jgi:hypothetical protein
VTIAVSLKVNDGLVLAADSASTIIGQDPSGQTLVINVYNNANKVFNLRKGLPIGAITWGAGAIGNSSISTLMKDLRQLFSNDRYREWVIRPETYTVEDAAQKVRRFMFDERYVPAFREWEGESHSWASSWQATRLKSLWLRNIRYTLPAMIAKALCFYAPRISRV